MNVEVDVFEDEEARRVLGDDFVESLDLHDFRLRGDFLLCLVGLGGEACMLETVYVVHRALGLYSTRSMREKFLDISKQYKIDRAMLLLRQTLNEGRNGADDSV